MKTSGLADSPFFPRKFKVKEKVGNFPKRRAERKHDSMTQCYQDSMIATIVRSVREVGKEACTYRLTPQEKTALVEIIYHYRMRNSRLSENEIARIAINFLIEDFRTNKKSCMLSHITELMKA